MRNKMKYNRKWKVVIKTKVRRRTKMKKDEKRETRNTLSFGLSKLAQAVMLVTCIRELTGLNPGWDTSYPDSDVRWLSSVASRKCRDSTSA
jgi:hypothetical protein